MTVTVIGGQKGGTGKSTIATNLAVAFVKQGRSVVLLDADKQATSANWFDVRGVSDLACIQKQGKLFALLQDIEQRYDEVIVDAGGYDSVELRTALPAADALYSPVRASQSDLWTLDAMQDLMSEAREMNPALRPYLLLSMVPTNPRVSEKAEARALLDKFSEWTVCESMLSERKAFRDAMFEGRGVLELPDFKARAEMNSFAKEVMRNASDADSLAKAG